MAYQRAENTDPFFMQDEAPAVFNVEIDGEPLNPFSESSDSNGRNYQPLSNSADTATLPMYNPGTDGLRQAAPQTAPQQQRQPWKIVSLTQSVFGGSTSSANQPDVQKSHAMADGGANYTVSQSFNAQDLNSRQKDRELEAWEAKVLREKEEALKQRESDLLERENALKAQQERSLNSQKKNFPPLCPVMRHHIKEDIPEDLRPLMRSILMLWLLSILAIFYNIFVCLIIMTNKSLNGNETTNFGVSFNYIFTVGVTSFLLWYMPGYHAFKKNNSFYYMLFIVFEGFHVLFLLYMSLGPGINSGSGGLINFIAVATNKKLGVTILTLVDLLLFLFLFLFALVIWFRVHRRYKKLGKSLQDVQNEAVRTIVSSEAGKSMGKAAAGAYIKSNTGDFV